MAIIMTGQKRKKARKYKARDDRKTKSFFVSASLWNRFGDWCAMHGVGRSRTLEELMEEEMGHGND